MLEPERLDWRIQQGICLLESGQPAEAKDCALKLAARAPDAAQDCSTLGLLLNQLGLFQEAKALYRRLTEIAPDEGSDHYNLGTMQRALGELELAEASFSRAIKLNAADYDAWYARSQLREQTVERNHIEKLDELLQRGIQLPRGEVQVCYALAKELEDTGQYAESFANLKRGADRRRQHLQYDVAGDTETMSAIAAIYDQERLAVAAAGCDSEEPIFVVGMPRTGTTLVECILGSHSQVYAAGELNNFAAEMTRAVDKKGLNKQQRVAASSALDFNALGEAYLNSTRNQTGHTLRFIDKLPLNFLYVGLIHLALPDAKIIHVQRHPLDTCYAVYKTLFQDVYPFSYDLDELVQYYIAYHRLMQHWQECLPGVIQVVAYEQLVSDLEVQAKILVAGVGLDWEPACLEFHSNTAASTTASASQVRQPVYQSSLGKWAHYQEELEPLADRLREAGINID